MEFLENQPDMIGNILPLVLEYLQETGKENRTSFAVYLRPLQDRKYITIYPEAEMGLNVRQAGVYVSDNIQVRLTFDGLDHLNELRKRNAPVQQTQPIVMHQDEELEHAILNFFKVVGRYASLEEMYSDLRPNGFVVDVWKVDPLIKNGCFDQNNDEGHQTFKINNVGLARLNRLDKKFSTQPSPAGVNFYGDIHGPVTAAGRDQIINLQPVVPKKNIWRGIVKWWTEHFIMRLIVSILGTWFAYLLLKYLYHRL